MYEYMNLSGFLVWVGVVFLGWSFFNRRRQKPIVVSSKPMAEEPQPEKNGNFDPANYEVKKTLMTPAERLFFEKLKMAIGDKYDIYPQVNLDKIFRVKYQASRYAFNAAKWSIDRRSVDFLITIRENQRPYIGIELDDSSHLREDRIERDEKVNALFSDNGMSLIRFNATDNFSDTEIQHLFEKYFP